MTKWAHLIQIPVFCAALGGVSLLAQAPGQYENPDGQGYSAAPPPTPYRGPNLSPVPLEWTPPALSQLQAQASVKSDFVLDRTMLNAAASMMPDSDYDVKQTINKLDGVSVHLMRFSEEGLVDPAEVAAVREAYHLRGWKHLVTTTDQGGPVHNGKADVWLVMDGVNVRGAVVLAQTPKSLTLVTVAGNLSPVDLLHLRGHFGIPRFDADRIPNESRQ
jgi:hypothetical protein